jgi:hypothetical protein
MRRRGPTTGGSAVWSLADFPAPTLHLDFAGVETVDPRITYTCASQRSYFNSAGQQAIAAINEWPREYDPFTLAPIGRSLWEARTNLLLNSTIDGANLATQDIATTAAARTLSFYGAGTVTLSGAHAAVVAGTGAFPTRTTYTYTPTAGTLTVAVSGTVQFAQDELGSFATPWIPTAGAAATRAATLASMTGANFSSWYNQTEGTFVASYANVAANRNGVGRRMAALLLTGSETAERMVVSYSKNAEASYFAVDNNVTQMTISTPMNGEYGTVAAAYKTNDFALSYAGGIPITDPLGSLPPPNALYIGRGEATLVDTMLNGWLSRLTYYPKRLVDSIDRGLSS